MKIKTLVAAVALAVVSSGANAAIANLNSQEGELFLTVFDPSAQTSYSLDLGINVSAMYNDSTSARAFDLSTDANFASFIGQTDLRYTVTAADVSFNDINTYGFMTTAKDGLAALQKAIPNDGFIFPTAIKIHDEAGVLNAQSGIPFAADGSNRDVNLSAFASVGDIGYYAQPSWGDTIGNAGFTSSQDVNTSVGFFQVQIDPNDGFTAIQTQLANEWLLTSDGSLTYASAVPVPAAVWLFGSGLVGLVGVGRRRKA